jgi:hypothetical protein
VQPRAEGLDVGLLEGRPDDLDPVANALAAQPGLEHHHDLVQRARALVVRWDQEQHPAAVPIPCVIANALEALADTEHALRRPDRRRVLGEPGDLLRPHIGARGDHQLVVGDGVAVGELHLMRVGIDARDGALHEVDVTTVEWPGQVDDEVGGVGAERDVDRVRPKCELLLLRDEGEMGAVAKSHAQQERSLQAGEAGAEDGDAGPIGHVRNARRTSGAAHPCRRASAMGSSPRSPSL